ncbi:hypothetical protein Emed_004043 [Eimeria media]
MAPIVQTAAVCLVALCSLHTAHAVNATGMEVQSPDDLILAINLARSAKLNTALVQVKGSGDLVTSAKAKITSDVDQATCLPTTNPDKPAVQVRQDKMYRSTCSDAGQLARRLWRGFSNAILWICEYVVLQLEGMVLSYTLAAQTTPNYKDLVQNVLSQGIAKLEQQKGQLTPWDTGFWKQYEETANLGYLMWSASVSVGCAVTSACNDNKFLILCHFNPTAGGSTVPFDENVYNALKARTTPITQMDKGDLQGPGSGATMGVPSLLLAGFVAALAMVAV